MSRTIRQTFLPLLAAFIWGTAFSAQSVAAEHMGAFSFNCLRSIVAAVFLLAVDVAAGKLLPARGSMLTMKKAEARQVMTGGVCCGIALFLAAYMQQLGMAGTSAGKAGFITAMYIVIVPLFSLLRGQRPSLLLWISVGLGVAGLYFLCVTETLTIVRSDLYILICAVLFSLHIQVIDHFAPHADGIRMSCVQFATVAVLSGAGMALTEPITVEAVALCAGPILYAGLLSSGVAYTLQILAQKDADPTVVSLLLSLESVFAALGGAVLLGERLAGREIFGCVLMLAGVVLAQLPPPKKTE